MKKLLFILLAIIISIQLKAQQHHGVIFENDLTWQEVKAKAKNENKLIFVDAYATWCGPCKRMDNEVLTDKLVGDLIQKYTIPVKVQMDRTDGDTYFVRSWYGDAYFIQNKFGISAFPTYLFLTSDGSLVNIESGYQDIEKFENFINTSLDAKLSYAGQIRDFRNGILAPEKLKDLAISAKKNKQDSIANEIAIRFKEEKLSKGPIIENIEPRIGEFLNSFPNIFSFSDTLIRFIFNHQNESDKALNWIGFSSQYVEFIIKRDWISSKINLTDSTIKEEPNWSSLEEDISSSFNEKIAKKLVLNARILWFTRRNDWNNRIKYEIKRVDFNGIDTSYFGRSRINNLVYEVIFKHGSNTEFLQKGIEYMEEIIKIDSNRPSHLDTYANILYKAGRKKEAQIQEERALSIARRMNQPEDVIVFEKVLKKMRNGEPTWL